MTTLYWALPTFTFSKAGIARLPKGRVGSAANLFSLNTKPDWTLDGTSELGCNALQNVTKSKYIFGMSGSPRSVSV